MRQQLTARPTPLWVLNGGTQPAGAAAKVAPGMGGLPVVPFFAAQPMAPAVFRATLIAYFPILDIYAGPMYWAAGVVSMDTLWAGLIALPITLLGNWVGGRHFLKTDPQEFRRFAIILLAGLAVLALVKAVI